MNLNAVARRILIEAGGALECTVFPGKYSIEMTSASYKEWSFLDQAIPGDLIKRGMAVKDENSPQGLRLLIEDYPYPVDGLEIWSAIKTGVTDYCSFYYKTDEMIQNDHELLLWWKELSELGHGDKKDAPWWPKMQTLEEPIETCATIIWIASCSRQLWPITLWRVPLNRPSMSRRLIPKKGTPEYDELKANPEKAFLKTINRQLLSVLGIALVEILSRHSSDAVCLGQRDTPEWTTDGEVLESFSKYRKKPREINQKIVRMNKRTELGQLRCHTPCYIRLVKEGSLAWEF